MRIGKLFHLTVLVDEFDGPQHFFNSIFSPLCIMHGYAAHWHRMGAIYIVAETSLEPMHVLPPREGEQGTSWYRYMERYGPRVHNLAFYVDDPKELVGRLEAAGVRVTGAGTDSTVFAHPKDTPGMLEFFPSGDGSLTDPRFSPGWDEFRRHFWPHHPLGLERLSHVTILVHDVDQATGFFTDVLDAVRLDEKHPTLEGATSSFVLVGEDTVLELTRPSASHEVATAELETVGQGAFAVTFKVGDVARAERFLRLQEAPIASVDATTITLDRQATWGVEYRFSTRTLAGDERN